MGGESLRVSKLAGRGATLVKLNGMIEEHLDPVLFRDLKGVVVIDLEGITRISSFGVRAWLDALKQLKASSYYFVRCPPTIVAQFNMVSGFAGAGTLVSLFAPFHCSHCDQPFNVLVDLRTEHARVAAFQEPEATCPRCGQAAEFDDLAEQYFSFAAEAPAPQIDAAAAALLDGSGTAPLKIKKSIEGRVTVIDVSGTIEKAAAFKRVGEGLEGVVVVEMRDVAGVTPSGALGLASFATTPGVKIYFKALPLTTVAVLTAVPGGFERVRVLSLAVSARCLACGDQIVELSAAALSRMVDRDETVSVACPGCRAQLVIAPTPQLDRAQESLPLVFDSAETAAVDAARQAPVNGDSGDPMFGSYRLARRIGAGGMAEVFLARQVGPMGFERNVVLKRILPHLNDDYAFVEMFLQEARFAAQLTHPNIVQIIELGHQVGQYYMALEYVRGWDLNVILRAAARVELHMPFGVACRLVAGVCAGLHAAHTHRDERDELSPIVHRDVTPSNVLVSIGGIVKLTDFGIAKIASGIGHTEPGVIKGKAAYLAPELVRSPGEVDGRSDVYAAGLVLYECLTFHKPFQRDSALATMSAILEDHIPPVSRVRADVPSDVQAVISRATSRDVKDRFATAQDMQIALEQVLSAQGKAVTAADVASWLQELLAQAHDIEGDAFSMPSVTPTGARDKTSVITTVTKEKI